MSFDPWKVGDKVRFAHQKKGEATYTIRAAYFYGDAPFVQIEGPGEFAAHVFVAADYPHDSIVPRPPSHHI